MSATLQHPNQPSQRVGAEQFEPVRPTGQVPACNDPVELTCCWTDGLPAEKVASLATWPRCRLPMDKSQTAVYASLRRLELDCPK